MAVFFTSDTHFGRAGARGLHRRPFESAAAMDAAMLERWNATVGPEDEVWHLGDFALSVSETAMAEHLLHRPRVCAFGVVVEWAVLRLIDYLDRQP